MAQYIYKYCTPTFDRLLRYTDPGVWEYTEHHTGRVTMPNLAAAEDWTDVQYTPERTTLNAVMFCGDTYRLITGAQQ